MARGVMSSVRCKHDMDPENTIPGNKGRMHAVQSVYRAMGSDKHHRCLSPLRAAVPFWGLTNQILSNLSKKRGLQP